MSQCDETGERESVQLHGRLSGFQGLVNACDDWDEKEWRLGWLAVAERLAGPVERMARWMERWKKREEAPVVVQAPREASSVQGVAERFAGGGAWISWHPLQWDTPLSKIISWRLTAVNSKLFAGRLGILLHRPSFSSARLSIPPSSRILPHPHRPPSTKDRTSPQRASKHESHPDRDRLGLGTRRQKQDDSPRGHVSKQRGVGSLPTICAASRASTTPRNNDSL